MGIEYIYSLPDLFHTCFWRGLWFTLDRGELSRRLAVELDDVEPEGLRRWGLESDEAEDYRLMHMRTKHFHGQESFNLLYKSI